MKLIKPVLAEVNNPIFKNSTKYTKDPTNFINNLIQGFISRFR